VLALVGAVFVVMLVMAGYKFIGAGSNKDEYARAQHTLTMAFLGLLLAGGAWTILFLIGKFLGIPNFGTFSICMISGCP